MTDMAMMKCFQVNVKIVKNDIRGNGVFYMQTE